MVKISLALISLLSFGFAGCLVEIPYDTTLQSQALVISGGVNDLKENQTIYLSKTLAYGVPPALQEGAKVTVVENNIKEYVFGETQPGVYVLDKNKYEPKTGGTYFVRLELNGITYQSDPETLMPRVIPDSLSWSVGLKTVLSDIGLPREIDVLKVQVHSPLINSEKNLFLKWDVLTSFQFTTMYECNQFHTLFTCFYSKPLNPSELKIFSNQDKGLNYLKNQEVAVETLFPNYKFVEIHYYSVYQHRISEQAYEYYRKLRLLSEQNGTIFDPIPASVHGNVYNTKDKNESVLGYFQVSSVSILRKKIVSADFDKIYPLLSKEFNYCTYLRGGAGPYFAPCCNCYALPEKVVPKP
ncbi:MAG: DUF4249 domain-containing protein, partial [Saprospiraceae bacterium]